MILMKDCTQQVGNHSLFQETTTPLPVDTLKGNIHFDHIKIWL